VQGDPGDFFYVISEGTADIFVNGNLVLQVRDAPLLTIARVILCAAHYMSAAVGRPLTFSFACMQTRKGMGFGELALLYDAPRAGE
jgi:CRP-like cAMP-binding protein